MKCSYTWQESSEQGWEGFADAYKTRTKRQSGTGPQTPLSHRRDLAAGYGTHSSFPAHPVRPVGVSNMFPSISQWVVSYLTLSVAFLLAKPASWNLDLLAPPPPPGGEPARVLLLTAHPDDECMFFAPTVLALLAQAPPPAVYSLCLSVGNADGLGETRREELGRSLDVLGVGPDRRWVVDRP